MKRYVICILLIFTLCGCANSQPSEGQSAAQPPSSVSDIQESVTPAPIPELAEVKVEKAELYDFTFFTASNSSRKFNLEKENILVSYHQGVLERHTLSVQSSEFEKSLDMLQEIEKYGNFPPYGTYSMRTIAVKSNRLLAYCDAAIGNYWVYNIDYSGTKAKAKDIGHIGEVSPHVLKNGAVLLLGEMIDWDGNPWPVQLQFDRSSYLPLWNITDEKYYIEDVYYDPDGNRYIALFGSIPLVVLARERSKIPLSSEEIEELYQLDDENYYETGIAVFNEDGQEISRFYFETQLGMLGISYPSKGGWVHGLYRLLPLSKDEFLIADMVKYNNYLVNLETQVLQEVEWEDREAFAAANPQITHYDGGFYETPKPCPLVVEYHPDGTYLYTDDTKHKQLDKLDPKYKLLFYHVDDTDTTYLLFSEGEDK